MMNPNFTLGYCSNCSNFENIRFFIAFAYFLFKFVRFMCTVFHSIVGWIWQIVYLHIFSGIMNTHMKRLTVQSRNVIKLALKRYINVSPYQLVSVKTYSKSMYVIEEAHKYHLQSFTHFCQVIMASVHLSVFTGIFQWLLVEMRHW